MKKKRYRIIMIGFLVLLLVAALMLTLNASGIFGKPQLNAYPEAFSRNSTIVVSASASPEETQAADNILSYLRMSPDANVSIKKENEVIEEEKAYFNLILIGIQDSNTILDEVRKKAKLPPITADYPGVEQGLIEIVTSPWNKEGLIILVAGSDGLGVQAASAVISSVYGLEKNLVIVDAEYIDETQKAVSLGLTPDEFRTLDEEIHEYFSNGFPVGEFPIGYNRLKEKEYMPGLVVIRANAGYMLPSPSATFGFMWGKVFLISKE
ncbi:MAG: cellulose biosynthesis cyclic di-GMP-binding regulatory protein BcsB [Dehalococcoidales bacterium]|nr:cellulose biosynthesis cyclic di-GMP-binding regulatory protein BcsB [Dehalococcoidales bacterium]